MSELPPAKDMEDLSGLFVRCEQDPEEPFQQRLQILRRMMDTAEKASEQFKQIWQQMEDWREEDIDELNEKEHQEVLRARELARTSARASSLGQSVPIQSPPPGAAASSSGPPARSYGVPSVRTAAEIIADAVRAEELLIAAGRVVTGTDPLVRRGTKRALEQQSNVSAAVEPPPDVFPPFCAACGSLYSGGKGYCIMTVEKKLGPSRLVCIGFSDCR